MSPVPNHHNKKVVQGYAQWSIKLQSTTTKNYNESRDNDGNTGSILDIIQKQEQKAVPQNDNKLQVVAKLQ